MIYYNKRNANLIVIGLITFCLNVSVLANHPSSKNVCRSMSAKVVKDACFLAIDNIFKDITSSDASHCLLKNTDQEKYDCLQIAGCSDHSLTTLEFCINEIESGRAPDSCDSVLDDLLESQMSCMNKAFELANIKQ